MSALPTFDHIEEELSAMLSIPDEELTEEQKLDLEKYLDELAGQEEDKIDRFCRFVRIETERAEAIKEESRRLSRKAQTAQSRIDYIKARYLNVMQQHGVRKISGKVYTRQRQRIAGRGYRESDRYPCSHVSHPPTPSLPAGIVHR